MAIYGIGIDLIEVKRIRDAIERFGMRFRNKIYDEIEQRFCESHREKYLAYAARFVAKEAFSKALGTGLRGRISWCDIIVLDNEKSPPTLKTRGRAEGLLNKRKVFLSISHIKEYASAIVIIEKNISANK
jgi:holo-[acyl-carrier protein] synthase